MEIQSTRFGRLEYAAEDVIEFPEGLPGLDDCRDWVLLADDRCDAVAWLQSLVRPEVALAVVSPRRFVPGFRLRVARQELEPLRLAALADAQALVVLGKSERGWTLNLKAPLVINLPRRVGRQVIANGDLPVQYELTGATVGLKKTA